MAKEALVPRWTKEEDPVSDEALRVLERKADAGDQEAFAQLNRERCRHEGHQEVACSSYKRFLDVCAQPPIYPIWRCQVCGATRSREEDEGSGVIITEGVRRLRPRNWEKRKWKPRPSWP